MTYDVTSKNKISERTFKKVFVLMICSTMLPWFDRGDYASSYWGFEIVFEHYLWIPFIYLIFFLWMLNDKMQLGYAVLAEVAFMGIIGIYIYSFLYFKRYMWTIYDPNEGMDLKYGLSVAMIPFWISVLLVLVTFTLFQIYLHQKLKTNKR